jgi:hypothetical protein
MLLPDLVAIDEYRLDHGWSWNDLSAEMKKVGVEMSPRTLYHICRRSHEDATCRDLTLRKIRLFIQKKRIRVDALSRKQLQQRRPASRVALHV